LYRIYPALKNFPKAEKYALSQTLKNSFFDILKNISLANKVKSKRIYYSQEADGNLQTLKVLIKLSCKEKYISKTFFRDIDLELTEIGKMIGGFIKSK
jgi:four helix bundle protein